MEAILLNFFLTTLNLVFAAWMYERKNYKTAIFNAFVAGLCFASLLTVL